MCQATGYCTAQLNAIEMLCLTGFLNGIYPIFVTLND